MEDFKDAELMLDITEHTLVPEHKVVEGSEILIAPLAQFMFSKEIAEHWRVFSASSP